MVLYDKNGLFLGIGNEELSLLGYEDMEEFRNYHNDFADLFMNKPGFIFKFKNFSWIDYALHSGTPHKKALIKLKNGKEIETTLSIHEIYLQHEINGNTLFYGIEVTHPLMQHDFEHTTAFEPVLAIPVPPKEETTLSESFSSSFERPSFTSSKETIEEDFALTPQDATSLFEAPIAQESDALDEESSLGLPLKSVIEDEEEPSSFKLKFDEAILETKKADKLLEEESVTPVEYCSIDQIQPHDLTFETVSSPVDESYPEDNYEDLLKDTTLFADEKTLPQQEEYDETFDLSECAESLGLDISTLAQIMEEYLETLSTSMPLITQAITINDRFQAKEELNKLKSVALHLHILSLYHHFEHLETSLDFDTKDEILHILEKLQHSIETFKESIL